MVCRRFDSAASDATVTVRDENPLAEPASSEEVYRDWDIKPPLVRPLMLWSVTDNVNQAKGDKDPAVWKPPLGSFWCVYASSWIDVKHDWDLSLQPAEKTALEQMLATC